MQLGVMRLLRSDFLAGWSSYEWRWRTRSFLGEARRYPQLLWDGGPLEGRRILLHSEQGIGDTIQFLRYAPLVAQRGDEVVLEVPPALAALAESLDRVAELVLRGADSLPEVDCRAPLMSLGRLFRTTIDSVPAAVPYLHAPDDLPPPTLPSATAQRRVRLVWAGDLRHRTDARRSIPPGLFARLRAVSGIRFVSLQRDRPARETAALARSLPLDDAAPLLTDFAATAKIVEGLDLGRLGAHKIGQTGGRGVIGAELHTLHIGRRCFGLGRDRALGWPGHGIEQFQILGLEQGIERRPGSGIELARLFEAGRQEGQRIEFEQRMFVAQRADQPFAELRLAGLHRAFDLVALVERAGGMDDNLDRAARCLADGRGEAFGVLRVIVARRIDHGHVPFLGRRCSRDAEREHSRAGQNL
jgi:hypothetical protein